MKHYWTLIVIVAAICAIAAIVRFLPPKTIIIETAPQKPVYDTVRIIETAEKKYFRAKSVELNRADSTALVSVYGIGDVFQRRIIEYRDNLGGFHSKTQLKEVRGITDEVYDKIQMNFWVDTLAIRKININFATQEQMSKHPYITKSMMKRLLGAVEMKGGYTTLRELLEDNILLPKEAQRLVPYISFSQQK